MTAQPVLPTNNRSSTGWGCCCVGFVLLALFAPAIGVLWWFELPWHLLTGWWDFARRSAERCRFVWTDVAFASAAIGALVLGVHFVARWLAASRPDASWRFLRSIKLVIATLLLFAAGIALLGIAHQSIWLIRSDSHLLDNNFQEFSPDRRRALLDVGEALHQSSKQASNNRPTDGDSHSWVLPLLPFLDAGPLAEKIDTSVPWNDPRNAEALRISIPALLSPAMSGTHDDRGFAISHFAANVHEVRAPHPWPGQGDTNRILIGEAFFRHRPWGDPRNVRDPLDGINHKPDGFGCAGSESTQFLMGDGSVRRMFHKIDPEVLKQLSRP